MTCPFCGDKNQSGDPCSPNQHCNNCDARVSGGKVVSKGNGGKKAARLKPPSLNPDPKSKIAQAIAREGERRDQPANQTVEHPEQPSPGPLRAAPHIGGLAVAEYEFGPRVRLALVSG